MKSRYKMPTYSEEDEMILKNTCLTEKENEYVDEIKISLKNKDYFCAIEQIFKFTKNKYTTSRLSQIYGVSTRQIQLILKDMEINRSNRSNHILTENSIRQKNIANKKGKSEYQINKESLVKNGTRPISFPNEVLEYELDNKIKEKINQKLNLISGIRNPAPNLYSLEEIFYYIYIMLFEYKYTTGEVADCFVTRSLRTIQKWTIQMDWNLDKFEVQQRIVDRGKRDYKQIRNKAKETKLKEGIDLHESRSEEYSRKKLNCLLPQVFKDCEVVVGLNNISILDNGKEIDIPVLIMKDGKLYKFAVEYNGSFWHKYYQNDIRKSELVINKGYILFSISIDDTKTYNSTINQIDKQIEIITDEMYKIINHIEL